MKTIPLKIPPKHHLESVKVVIGCGILSYGYEAAIKQEILTPKNVSTGDYTLAFPEAATSLKVTLVVHASAALEK